MLAMTWVATSLRTCIWPFLDSNERPRMSGSALALAPSGHPLLQQDCLLALTNAAGLFPMKGNQLTALIVLVLPREHTALGLPRLSEHCGQPSLGESGRGVRIAHCPVPTTTALNGRDARPLTSCCFV